MLLMCGCVDVWMCGCEALCENRSDLVSPSVFASLVLLFLSPRLLDRDLLLSDLLLHSLVHLFTSFHVMDYLTCSPFSHDVNRLSDVCILMLMHLSLACRDCNLCSFISRIYVEVQSVSPIFTESRAQLHPVIIM